MYKVFLRLGLFHLTFTAALFSTLLVLVYDSLLAGLIDEDVLLDGDVGLPHILYDSFYPIDINRATYQDLQTLTFLSEAHIQKIIAARQIKPLSQDEDLQRAGLPHRIVEALTNYITFDPLAPIGLNQRIRYYQRTSDDVTTHRYYQQSEVTMKSTRVGFTSASDTLETALTANNSYYLFHRSDGLVNSLALGNYRLSLGQGIAYAPAFGFSKSSATVAQPVKNFTPLRPHTSPFHQWSLQGAAAVFSLTTKSTSNLNKASKLNSGFSGQVDIIPFYSSVKLNARLENDKIRTIYPFGEHKIEHEKSVNETIKGVAFRFDNLPGFLNRFVGGSWQYGCYYSHHEFDKEFVVRERNNEYQSLGVFFRHDFDKFSLFGEYASIDNKRGLIAGIRWGRSPLRQLLLYREYEDNIPVWHGNPFAAASTFDNERGVYYGLGIKPLSNLTMNLYFDLWRYPETSYFEKMPVTRADQFLQVIYNFKDDRLRFRLRNKDYDKYRVIDDERKIRREKTLVTSLDWSHQAAADVTVRTGVEFTNRFIPEAGDYKDGMLFYNNIRWRRNRVDIRGLINAFSSQIMHYPYEYTLQGMWESRPLSGDDIYVGLIGKFEIMPRMVIETKAARFFDMKRYSFISQLTYRL